MDIRKYSWQQSWESVFGLIRGLSMDSRNPMSMWLSGCRGYSGKTLVRLWSLLQVKTRQKEKAWNSRRYKSIDFSGG